MPRDEIPNAVSTSDASIRRDDIEVFPTGDGSELIYSPRLHRARVVPVDVSLLLQRCDAFRPPAEHAERFCELHDLPVSHTEAFSQWLEELARDGFLISRGELREQCLRAGNLADESARVAALTFPTKNRVAILRRGVSSFIENCRRHGRDVEFVVSDDSDSPQTREECREMLRQLARATGARIAYAGTEEKRRFAEALIAESGCATDLVEFALFNPLRCPRSTGANHNALALHLAGAAYVNVDDDVVCRITQPPDARTEGAALHTLSDPTAHWFFPSLDAATNAKPILDADFVGLHERLLGRDLAACVAQLCAHDELNTEKMGDEFLRRLRSRRGKVLATFAGVVGDPGVGSTLPYLWTDGATFDRLIATEQAFDAAMTQRAVLRCAPQHSIGGANVTMNLCMGFDRRGLMPPFLPVQRGQDDLMGKILWHVFLESLFAHLPFAVAHLPEQPRALPKDGAWRRAHGTYTAEILAWCCQSFESRLDGTDRAGRLRGLGRHLMEMGALPLAEFEDFVRRHFFADRSARLAHLEYRLAEADGRAPFWEKWLRDYTNSLREHLANKECALPTDLVRDFGEEEGRALMPLLTQRFGELLAAWEQLTNAAVQLQRKEIRVAQPLK
jgi:hypothetical protein